MGGLASPVRRIGTAKYLSILCPLVSGAFRFGIHSRLRRAPPPDQIRSNLQHDAGLYEKAGVVSFRFMGGIYLRGPRLYTRRRDSGFGHLVSNVFHLHHGRRVLPDALQCALHPPYGLFVVFLSDPNRHTGSNALTMAASLIERGV